MAKLSEWADTTDANGEIVNFNVANAITDSFKFKRKITSKTGKNCIKMWI